MNRFPDTAKTTYHFFLKSVAGSWVLMDIVDTDAEVHDLIDQYRRLGNLMKVSKVTISETIL